MTVFRLLETAEKSQQKLPEAMQAKLWSVINLLARDPQRGEPFYEGASTRLYEHPEPPLDVTYEYDADKEVITFLHFAIDHVRLVRDVFLSYSHEDKEWRKRIRAELDSFETLGAVRIFVDTDIPPAEEWDTFIEQHVGSANAALLLVSESFLESAYAIEKEISVFLHEAPKKTFKLLWVLVKECDWSTDANGRKIGTYQALLDPHKPLADLGRESSRKLKKLRERFAQAMSLRREDAD